MKSVSRDGASGVTNEPPSATLDARSLGLFLTTALAWAGNYLFVLVGLAYTTDLWLAALRASIGFLGVLFYALAIRHDAVLDAAGRRDAMLLGIPNTALFLGLWFAAAPQVPAGETAVIIYTFPLWVALLSPWVLHHPLTPRHWASVAIGFGGVVLISQPWAGGGAHIPPLAIVELLAAAVSWAVGTVLFQRRFRGTAAMREANLFQLGGGALALLVATLLFGPLTVPSGPPAFWISVLWIGVFGTAYAYVAWYTLLAKVRAVTLATYTFIIPLFALLLGFVFLGERFAPVEGIGIGLVISALYLIGSTREVNARRAHPPRSTPDAEPPSERVPAADKPSDDVAGEPAE